MSRKQIWKTSCAALAVTAMLQNTTAFAVEVAASSPTLTLAGATGTASAQYTRDPSAQTPLTQAAKLQLLRQQVKYVFVIFQENRSFDHYFGTYPGANGLFTTYSGAGADAQPANTLPSFNQKIRNIDGSDGTVVAVPDAAHRDGRERQHRSGLPRGHGIG